MERWRALPGRPQIFGHRGVMARSLENTVESFQLARDQGADGVELDVRPCAGGQLVVFHDDDLRRLAGRGERIDALSFEEVRAVRLDGGRRIPTLDEVFETLGPDMRVNVELKAGDAATIGRLAECIARHQAGERVLVSSFYPRLLAMARRRLSAIPIGYLFHDRQPRAVQAGWPAHLLRATAVHPQHTILSAERIERWRGRGYLVNTWTVDGARVAEVAAMDVDVVISNDPGAALAALSQRPAPPR